MITDVLNIEDIVKDYNSKNVINNISMSINPGEIIGLLGPNGAGKTTLFYIIMGLIRPNSGQIKLDGHDITKLAMYSRARLGISYLPQEPSIFRGMNVRDNINCVLEITEKNSKLRKIKLEKLIEIFSINLQIILIYFWIIKRPNLMGPGHIFLAGLINDVVMGFPLGISSLSYLVVCFVGNYVRNKSVNTTIASDWVTFLIALLFANLLFFTLLNNFSEVAISYAKIGYNTFFTLFLFPVFWLLFNLYQISFIGSQDA